MMKWNYLVRVALAPYIVDVIPANIKDENQKSLAEGLYKDFQDANIDVMIDDRDENWI